MRAKQTKAFRVLLTPHCYLTVQEGKSEPKIDRVVTVGTLPASNLIGEFPPSGKDKAKRIKGLGKCIQSPPRETRPEGGHWFLPGFLDIPDLFCDFLDVQSLSLSTLASEYEPIATLAAPYAEALQSCFTGFYSAVGLPNLDPARFAHLLPDEADG